MKFLNKIKEVFKRLKTKTIRFFEDLFYSIKSAYYNFKDALKEDVNRWGLISLLIIISGYNLWCVLGEWFFFIAVPTFVVVIYYTLSKAVKNKVIVNIAMTLATSAIIDEIFFDPCKFSWNEYIGALFVLYFLSKPNKNELN